MIQKTPIYIDLDRRREVVFNLNTEILIRGNGGAESSLWTTIGKQRNEKTGAEESVLDVNLENLRLYLWAALESDARAHGEMLTIEEVGALLTRRAWVYRAMEAMTKALKAYYGDVPGEAGAPPAK